MNTKKPIILSIIALFVLISLVVGATFAYFQAQGGVGKSADITVKTYTTDTFTFATGNPITFTLDQDNFASGKGNVTGSTFASAILTANNKTNTATEHYYVYLNIENNTFTYSINESTPEIIMTVTNSSGTEITDISGLTHTSVTDGKGTTISGYDITNKSGLITLFNNREIVATPTKEEKWNIKVTFVNYNANQNANSGNSMSAKVIIQKEKLVQTMANVCKNGQTLSSCVIAMDGIDETLYHHTSTLANGAGDNSYRYAGASDKVNNYICLGSAGSPCSDNNLFRIIGVFGNQVKVIRAKSIENMVWDTNGSNTWSTSSLNTYLKETYLSSLGTFSEKIVQTTWKVGGNTTVSITRAIPSVVYQNEIQKAISTNTTDNATEYQAKIGLMYVSDYGYAAEPSAWKTTLYNYNKNDEYGVAIKTINWLYLGSAEWTISRSAATSDNAFGVYRTGNINNYRVNSNNSVRPVFNLESSITYVSGSGSAVDPIVIN